MMPKARPELALYVQTTSARGSAAALNQLNPEAKR